MLNDLGVENLSLDDLTELFNSDEGTQDPPPATEVIPPVTPTEEPSNDEASKKEQTKAFAKRLKESTDKAIANEREAIAKSMGFNSYEEMIKSKEQKLIEDAGLDPEQVSPVVEELVKRKLNDDPRMKELELLRRQQIEEFGKRELAEITKLTGGEITSLTQLPREVIVLWKQKGSLKSAYMELEGEKLINKIRSEQSKGSTGHLANLGGTTGANENKRPLTAEEKEIWKLFRPSMTQKELDEKTINK